VGDVEQSHFDAIMRGQDACIINLAWRAMHKGGTLLGDPHLDDLGDGLHVPVAEALIKELIDCRDCCDVIVIVRICLPVVVRRDLKSDTRSELYRTKLGTSPPQRATTAPARTHSPDKSGGVQEVCADLHSHLQPGLAH